MRWTTSRVIVVAAGLLLAACGSSPITLPGGGGNSAFPVPPGGGQVPGTSQQSCTLPTVTDQYAGFRIGVPQGWTLSRVDGGLDVSRDSSGSTETFIVPALAANGLTAASFYTTVTQSIEKLVNNGSQSISFSQTGSDSGGVQAAVSGQLHGTAISGNAEVIAISLASKHASQLLVFAAYWAPTSQLPSLQPTLAGIAACYQLGKGQLLRVYRDQQFTYALPPNWTPSEQFNELNVNDGNDASANFFFLETVTPAQGVTDAQSLLQYFFQQVHISVSNVISQVAAPSSTSSTGALQETRFEEFTGTFNGSEQIHSVVSVDATTVSGSNTSGVVRIALARADLWNSLAGVLLQIAGGIQHSFVQDLGQIANVSQQWQNFNQQVAGFDDALNGVDIAVDPSTGIPYEVPYGNWDTNGPGGPGYYLPGGSTPLQVVTP